VSGPAGGERQRRHAEKQDEDEREALLLDQVDQAAERLVALALQPPFQLGADTRG